MDENEKELCEICHQRTVEKVVVQYIDGEKKKLKVCNECVLLVGVDEQLKNKFIALEKGYEMTHSCSFCGWKFKNIVDTGLLGCPYCFVEFEDEIKTIIEHFHNVKTYDSREKNSMKTRLMVLNTQLDKAISEERFEDAARIRDMIKKNEKLLDD